MIPMTSNLLRAIITHKRAEIERAKRKRPLSALKRRIKKQGRRFRGNFAKALVRGCGVHLIAEIKKASPSMWVIRRGLDIRKTARLYERAGACAVSILTESRYFKGCADHLRLAKRSVACPILRKDFIVDEYQLYESVWLGADAVLLIMGILSDRRFAQLYSTARRLKLDVLVEVHDRSELRRALAKCVSIVGINNRNLRSMRVDVRTTTRLLKHIPERVTVVAESGFRTREEIQRLSRAGVDAFLVGTSILRSVDMASKIRDLRNIGHGASR